MKNRLSLRHINWLLASLIVLINLYVIAVPFLPALQFWLDEKTNQTAEAQLTEEVKGDSPKTYETNTIIIPRLRLSEKIFEGPDISAANKGVWHRPNSSSPNKESNTVLVGHRFTYQDPKGVFYHLDKVKVGDELAVFWNKQRYNYVVTETKTVPASEASVEAPTTNAALTLYTCTPLWSAKDRLVVTAIPIPAGQPTEKHYEGAIND